MAGKFHVRQSVRFLTGRWRPTVCGMAAIGLAVFLGASLFQPAGTHGQTGKKRPAISTKALDIRANKTVEEFTREAVTIAKDYEDAGQLERARQMLKAVQSLKPESTVIEEQIKRLDQEILSANEYEVEIDVSKGWGKTIGRVAKGKRFRIAVEGDYRFVTDLTIGPTGFPTEDPISGEMIEDVPAGCVVGIMLPLDKKKAAKAKPFPVGVGIDYTPNDDGVLFLRVNAPNGAKCKGTLQVTLSGYIAKP